MIRQALILASGKGTRMRPLTNKIPKPLVKVNDISMLDRIIKHVENIGIEKIVINTYHLSEIMEKHINNLNNPKITISHEDRFMENGGAVLNALQYLDNEPFLLINSDIVWFEENNSNSNSNTKSNLKRLATEFNPKTEDILMLLKKKEEFIGYRAKGDFDFNIETKTISRPHQEFDSLPYAFIGVQAVNPIIFKNNELPEIPFLFRYFYFNSDTWQENGLLNRIRGIEHKGKIFHVGTIEDIEIAKRAIKEENLER